MKRVVSTALAVMLWATGYAVAQDYPPLIEDLPPRYDLNADGAIDILGVELGQTREDAYRAMQAAFPGVEITSREDVIGLRDNRGNAVSFAHHSRDSLSVSTKDFEANTGQSTRLEVRYTTAISGERVVSIARNEEYNDNDQPALADLVAALEAKYGEAAARVDPLRGAGLVTIYFGWNNGVPAVLTEAQRETFGRMRIMQDDPYYDCLDRVFNLGSYGFVQERVDAYPGCTLVMKVQIFPGRRDDLVSSFSMELTDYRRWYDNGVATDAFLIEAFEQALSSTGAGDAPGM
jgi:hypothetical protein